jgi:transcriptional regulator with XRE-family HTH domain
MSIGEALLQYRQERGISQRELARQLHVDHAMISKAENGKLELAEHHDANVARLDWRLAVAIIDERTGGYISNILDEKPNMDLHPAALSMILRKDLRELQEEMEGLIMAKHIDPEKQRAKAEKLWHELKDVLDVGVVMMGVLEEEFQLDRKRLRLVHEMEVREGKR